MKTSLRRCFFACLLLAGCKSSEPINENERVQTLRRAAPSLPYTARIVVNGGDEETRTKVSSLVHQVLLASDALIGKCVTDSGSKADITFRIDMRGIPASGNLPDSTISVGFAMLSSSLWLFGGIPGWFTRDRTFDPWDIRMRIEREGEKPQLEGGTGASKTDLNFIERSSWPWYFVQIIIPPAVLPANESYTKESLIEKFSEPLQMWVMDQVKLKWPLAQLTGRHAIAQIQDNQVVIFSPDPLIKAERDGVEIPEEELNSAFVRNEKVEKLHLQRLRDTLVTLTFLDEQRLVQASLAIREKSTPGPADDEGTLLDDAKVANPNETGSGKPSTNPLVNLGVDTLLGYNTYSFAMDGGSDETPLATSFRATDAAGKTLSWTLRPPVEPAKPVN